ncbi:MAG: DUF4143 domain-containing protein [Kineosporiaceae bacterium]
MAAAPAGVNRATAGRYESLFADLLVVRRLPAWSSSRVSRLARASKVHLVDPALVAAAATVTLDDRLRDGDLMGRVLETFVVAQVAPVLDLLDPPVGLFHLRDQGGRHEVTSSWSAVAGSARSRSRRRPLPPGGTPGT